VSSWTWIPAACLFGIGFSIYVQAFRGFHHSQVSGLDELEPDRHCQELVTSGIRARVRHPIYLGHLCEVLGWCVGTGLLGLYVLAGFALVTGFFMIRVEDRELEQRFGERYHVYRRNVPAVIPRFGP
jgi:protein-S-isoprenylcysteine O-methyltransferase Ste14